MKVRNLAVIIGIVMFVIGITGCGSYLPEEEGTKPKKNEKKSIKLEQFASCEETNTFVRTALKEKLQKMLDETAKSCANQYDDYTDDGNDPSVDASISSSVNFSETNNQESGVDEADIYKTGTNYTYLLADGKMRIIKTAPVSNLAETGSVDIEGIPFSLYLIGNRVIVFSGVEQLGTNTTVPSKSTIGMATAEYISIGYFKGKHTKVTVIDVSNATAPSVVRESYYSGTFNTARRIGERVYVVTSPSINIPYIDTEIDYKLLPKCDNSGKQKTAPSAEFLAAIEKLKEENLAKIDSWKISIDQLEAVHKRGGRKMTTAAACNEIARSTMSIGESLVGINSIVPNGTEVDDKNEFVMAGRGTVYASTGSVYITAPLNETHETVIHRFQIGSTSGEPAYFGSAKVDGRILNQFSLSEYNGHLRVASTRTVQSDVTVWGSTNETLLNILDISAINMPTTGTVEGIGAGEDVKSVRMIGERGFIVTYKQVDPLFVLDLSDPANPFLAGELKVPGFSTYLHQLDEKHLIGFGKGSEDNDGIGWEDSLKISIFDVTDSSNPVEDDSLLIAGRGSISPALDDHLAFTFAKAKGLLALPLTSCSPKEDDSWDAEFNFNGAGLYNISATNGVSLKSELKEQTVASNEPDEYGFNDECNGHFYNGKVQRTIFMTDSASKTHVVMIKTDGVSIYTDTGVKEKSISW